MDRKYYLALAEDGLAMPIAADLALQEQPDPEEVLLDGGRLGEIIRDTAYRFGSPLAIPHMDLELEKKALLQMLGVAVDDVAKFHFEAPPTADDFKTVERKLIDVPMPRLQAQFDATRYIAARTELLPIGMSIGPFSLMTKLVSDPIAPVCMAGAGLTAADDSEIALVESALELGMLMILNNVQRHINAGAKAVFIAEPAANMIYFSPNQIEGGSDIFDRYVMSYNRRIKDLLEANEVDLIFHCCGDLTDYMVGKFAELDPAILSLGSSRKLWEDAEFIPKDITLLGNLPSKKFYSDELITVEQVVEAGRELMEKMRRTGHPFILSTECDVLSVPGCERAIVAKAEAFTQLTGSIPCLAALV